MTYEVGVLATIKSVENFWKGFKVFLMKKNKGWICFKLLKRRQFKI